VTTPIPTSSPHARDASNLDRRRGKAQTAKDAADQAQAGVADLDAQLAANATQAQQDQAALQRAHDEVIRLKRSLKDAAKESIALQGRRKKASAAAVKAQAKAQAAEAKYDEVVLAEIVRREKDRDRAAAAATEKIDAPAAAAEQPTKATATATRTATRTPDSTAAGTTNAGGTRNGNSTSS
jgi:hypothetical protein